MKKDAKCFIRIAKGIFEEISYKELEERRITIKEYNKKKFIPIQGMLLEVTEDEYKAFYKEVERNKYVKNESKKYDLISINDTRNVLSAKENEIIDKKVNVDTEVLRNIEVEMLKEALLKLSDEEYQLIRAFFFEDKSIREYAKILDKPFTTIEYNRKKILNKLKKILKNL